MFPTAVRSFTAVVRTLSQRPLHSIPHAGVGHIEEIQPGKGAHPRCRCDHELRYQLSKAGWHRKLAPPPP